MSESGTIAMVSCDDGELNGTPEQLRSRVNDLLDFGMHRYYDQIHDFMFPTRFIDLTREQAEAWRLYQRNAAMTEEQKATFDSLTKAVDDAIHSIRESAKSPKSKIFIKLSSRSAKDAVWNDCKRTAPILKTFLKKMKDKNDLNEQMIQLRRAFLKASAVSSAKEAFELMQWSSRIITDLILFTTASQGSEWFDVKLVVRQFMDDLDIADEYRGFVHNGQLTALSQYQTECFFPQIASKADQIANKIKTFFSNELFPRLPDWAKSASIIDFAIVKDRVYVVELNPFSRRSGSCLFDWKEDDALLNGNAPFEIRVVKEPLDHLEAHFAPWEHLLKEAKPKGLFGLF